MTDTSTAKRRVVKALLFIVRLLGVSFALYMLFISYSILSGLIDQGFPAHFVWRFYLRDAP